MPRATLAILFLLTSTFSLGNVIDLTKISEPEKIGKFLYILEDTNSDLTFAEVKDKLLEEFELSKKETPKRLQKGKTATGYIEIVSHVVPEGLRIDYRDDGRGIDLEKLVQKAHEAGILNDNDGELSPEKKAELMFETGISTADKVTNISGRGIGMKAVQEFIHQSDSKLKIALDKDTGANPIPFHFEIYLPHYYFQVYDEQEIA